MPLPIDPAPYRAAPLGANGLAAPEWLKWYAQIVLASGTVAANNATLATLTAGLA
jgi:hypothetical protein